MLHNNEVEKLSFRRELEDQVDSISLVEGVFEAEHVWMTDAHENGDL